MARPNKTGLIWKNGRGYLNKECHGCGEVKLVAKTGKYCSLACSGKADKNPPRREQHYLWKGENISYSGIHKRLEIQRGSASWCTICWEDCPDKPYEWASLLGNYTDVSDFVSMCPTCHHGYDKGRRMMEESKCTS